MSKIFSLTIVAVGVLLQFEQCTATCYINIPSDNAPVFYQKFGDKTFIIPFIGDKLVIEENEVIWGHCSSGFGLKIERDYYRQNLDDNAHNEIKNVTEVNITCSSSHFVLIINSKRFDITDLRCKERVWNLYETQKPLTNCEAKFMSYALGVPTPKNPIIYAGVCSDLDTQSLKYVNYIAKKTTSVLEHQEENYPEELDSKSLGQSLGNFRNFLNYQNNGRDFQEGFTQKKAKNAWLKFAEYSYTSLIQSKKFREETFAFEQIFGVIWWENLRLGNWQRFIDAFDKRSDSVTYSVYTGTSGEVQIPTDCNSSETLIVEYNVAGRLHEQTIPKYVWSYIRSLNTSISEDFVVIGFNSPYFGYFDENKTMFCNDICNTIEWLAPIQKSRKIPTFGVIFCCRPEEVQDHLEGFPKNRKMSAIGNQLNHKTIPQTNTERNPDVRRF